MSTATKFATEYHGNCD